MKEKIVNFFKKYYIKLSQDNFWGRKYIFILIIFNFLLNFILWGIVIFKSLSIEIPLYNPIISSARFLTVRGKEIYILPIIGFLISIINIFLANRVFNRENFLSYLFLGINIFIQILLLFTVSIYLLI